MTNANRYVYYNAVFVVVTVLYLGSQMAGCAGNSYTAKGTTQGAATGAVAGAVGGLVSALVFGGDPADRAARGAVWGGTTGAVTGAIAGSQVDRQIEQQREAELSKLRQEMGEDAFGGLEALADCQHDVSMRQASKAQQSKNPNHALAGLWLEVLSYADKGDEPKMRNLFPAVVEKDWDIKTESQAEEVTLKALNELMNIRQEYNMPRACK